MSDNARIAADIAEMNRLMKVYATFDAESLIAKLLDAEIDRLSDVIEAALKVETPDLVTHIIPPGGMALTAQQLADIRTMLGTTFSIQAEYHEAFKRLEADFLTPIPAAEPAEVTGQDFLDAMPTKPDCWDVCEGHSIPTETDKGICTERTVTGIRCDRKNGHPGEHRLAKWGPAEPAEEETKAEDESGWHWVQSAGGYYSGPACTGGYGCRSMAHYEGCLRPSLTASSPVVPAPTETEWPTVVEIPVGAAFRPAGYTGPSYIIKTALGYRITPNGDHRLWNGAPVGTLAPFVAAKEG